MTSYMTVFGDPSSLGVSTSKMVSMCFSLEFKR